MNGRLAWATRWPTNRLAYLFEPRTETGLPTLDVLSVYRDYGVIPKTSRDDNFNRTPVDLSRYQVVYPGDVVVNRMKAWQGSLGVSALQGLVSPDYDVLRPTTSRLDMRFLHHLLRSRPMIGEYAVRSTGIRPSQWRLYWAQMRMIDVPVPEVPEQRGIADYLDRETAQIDTLIEEQQRLIELLRERRQAQIDAAVAGVTAQYARLRRLIKFITSGSRGWGDYYSDEGERFLRIGNLPRANLEIRGEVQHIDLPCDVTEGERTRLAAGDLLFSITAYLGSVAVVEGDWVGGYVSQHVALCRVDSGRAEPRFIGWVMLSTSGQDQLRQGAAGGTKQQLALDDIRELQIPLPSLNEQRRIVSYLDERTAKIDMLIAETEKLIELARERRSAIITAAITGQIVVPKSTA